MSRRRDNSPSVSFFSFQDIITSVTGIMFLVVLMLILMLLMRQDYTPEEHRENQELDALEAELEALKEQLAASAQASEAMATRLAELEKLNLKDVPSRIQALNGKLAELDRQSRDADERQRQRKAQLEELKRLQEKLAEALTADQQEKANKVAENEKLAQELAKMEKKKEAVQKTVRFTWQRSTRKKPLLIECGETAINIGTTQNEAPLAALKGTDTEQLVSKLLKQLQNYKPDSYYLVLLVKPGAFSYVEVLAQELKRQGYERGREVLPSDDARIFQEVAP